MVETSGQREYRIAEFNALRAEIIMASVTMRVLFTAALAAFGVLVPVGLNGEAYILIVASGILFTIAFAMVLTYWHVMTISRYILDRIEKTSGVLGWEKYLARQRIIPFYWLNSIGMAGLACVPLVIYFFSQIDWAN